MGKKKGSKKKKVEAPKVEKVEEKKPKKEPTGILRYQAKFVTRFPLAAVLVVIVLTGLFIGIIAVKGIDDSSSEGTWDPDLEIANMNTEVNQRFTDSYSIAGLLKGADDDSFVTTPQAFVEILEMEMLVINDTEVQRWLHDQTNPYANVMSPASVIGNFLVTSAQMMMGVPPQNISVTHTDMIDLFSGMDQTAFEQNISMLYANPMVPEAIKTGLGFLFSKDFDPENGVYDAKACFVSFSFTTELRDLSEDEGIKIEQHIVNLIKKGPSGEGYQHLRASAFADKVINKEIIDAMNESNMIVMPIAFLVVVIILAITYRDVFDIIVSTIALFMSIIWMYGFGSLFDFNFNPMTSMVPVLLIGLGIDYGIHVTHRYREEIMKGERIIPSVRNTILSVGAALSLATLTTLVSFLSNLSSPMDAFKEFGLLACAGIVASFITMTVFVPGAKQLKDNLFEKRGWRLWLGQNKQIMEGARTTRESGDCSDDECEQKKPDDNKASPLAMIGVYLEDAVALGTTSGAVVAKKAPWAVLIVAVLITGISAYGWMNVSTEFDFRDFLPDSLEVSKDLNYMIENFGTGEDFTVIYFKGDITQPEVYHSIDEVRVLVDDTPNVVREGNESRVTNLNTMMYDLAHYTGGEGVTDFTFDPVFMGQYSTYFNSTTGLPLAHTTSTDIEGLLDYIYEDHRGFASTYIYKDDDGNYAASVIRISVAVEYNDESGLDALMADLDDDSQPLKDSPHIDYVIVTGGPIVGHIVLRAINDTQISSIFITMMASAAMLIIVFIYETKSLKLDIARWIGFGGAIGLLTMVPVLLCMVWIMGSMYILDYNLDVMTISVTSLTIGLGITYAIHYTHRFLEDLQKYGDPFRSLKQSSKHTGVALLGAAATTIAGFGMLNFSLLPPMQKFGVLTAMTIFYSFIATVLILPSLLGIWAKLLGRRGTLAELEDTTET